MISNGFCAISQTVASEYCAEIIASLRDISKGVSAFRT